MPLPLCWLCRTFLARAEASVPKEAVAAGAARLCRVLPAVVAGACQCLAQRYAVLALEGVLGRLGPSLLCRLLLSCRTEDGYAPLSPSRRLLGATAVPPAACGGTEVSGVTGWRGRGWHCRVSSWGRVWGGAVCVTVPGDMTGCHSPKGTCRGPKGCHSPKGHIPGCHRPWGHTLGCHSPRGQVPECPSPKGHPPGCHSPKGQVLGVSQPLGSATTPGDTARSPKGVTPPPQKVPGSPRVSQLPGDTLRGATRYRTPPKMGWHREGVQPQGTH